MIAPHGPEPGLVSVIVPCLGPLAATRRCMAAVLRHSQRPWELIAVTRGGNDATALYLAGVGDAAGVPVDIVAEPGLKGLRAAWVRGLRQARGEFVAFVGPNVIVTDAWLEQLVALATADPTTGMTGPASPAATPKMVTEHPDIDASGELDAFAARWRAVRRGKWSHEEALAGHCLLLKRGVLETIQRKRKLRPEGLRSDRLSRRVHQAGFRLALAHDLYVHQEGTSRRIQGAGSSDLAASSKAATRRCKVSLTMIVRNEEDNLPDCLTSAEGLFDEIVVVDTGSTDRTVEIARSFGARVFDFVWVDDFAAARNAALARATGDYAFWLDADDRIEAPQRDRLCALLDGLRAADTAHVVRCSCDPDPRGGGATVVDHVRLFPVLEDVRWTYAVHEQILPALRRAGVPVRWTDVVVRHVGYNDPALRRSKLLRDRAILEAELTERPDDPFVLFNLGNVAMEVEDPRAALGYLKRSLAGSAPSDSIVRKLHALIARAHQVLGESEAALAACGAGLATEPEDAELLFRKAVLHRHRG